MSFLKKLLIVGLVLLSAVACGSSDAYILGPQTYKDIDILVEIRPGAPTVGMNEFLVMATHKNRRPAADYVVSIKIKGLQDWHQSIQDGETGVYRRAIRVNDPDHDILSVQFVNKDEKHPPVVLDFPLHQSQKHGTKGG
jgi:hypothetical protein